MKKTLLHYTLNTGDTRVSPREEVRDEIVNALASACTNGTHTFDRLDGYEFRNVLIANGLECAVYAEENRPCVLFGVAPDDDAADAVWPALESSYLAICDNISAMRRADFEASRRPKSTPWVAAVTLMATPDEAHWIADFERCLGWAVIERGTFVSPETQEESVEKAAGRAERLAALLRLRAPEKFITRELGLILESLEELGYIDPE